MTLHFEKVSKLRSKVDKKVTTFRKNIRPGRFDPYGYVWVYMGYIFGIYGINMGIYGKV